MANPRSYCYLDNRRMIRTDGNVSIDVDNNVDNNVDINVDNNNNNNNGVNISIHMNIDVSMDVDEQYSYAFAVPDPHDVKSCPTYDQWQWGLEPGGDILCPYKDAALRHVNNNATAMALRYAKRKVFYLAGEQDTIVKEDRCETYDFQGDTRNERARRYFQALNEYFTNTTSSSSTGSSSSTRSSISTTTINTTSSTDTNISSSTPPLVHEFRQVPGSPHDHTIMFQSAPGREAFFGATSTRNNNMNDDTEKEKEDEKSQNNIISMEGENDNDNDNEYDDNGEATTKYKRTSIRTGMPTMQSTFFKRLKEVLMNLCFSTTDIDIDIGSDVRVVRAVKK